MSYGIADQSFDLLDYPYLQNEIRVNGAFMPALALAIDSDLQAVVFMTDLLRNLYTAGNS